MEQVGVALGATAKDINAMFRDARIPQLAAVDGRQIDSPGLFHAKFTRYVRTHFVAARADARPYRRADVRRFRAVEPVHFFQRADDDTRRRAAPSGMHRGHCAIPAVGQQYGVTIRGTNRYRNTRERGDQRIAFTGASDLLCNPHDAGVDLLQASHALLGDRVGASAKSMVQPLQLREQWRIQHANLVDCPIQQQ